MRSLLGFLTTLVASTIGTGALEASLINFGAETHKQNLDSSIVSETTLQRLLELRSQPSATTTLDGTDDNSIELLSNLSGRPSTLFGASIAGAASSTILVILEGLGHELGRLNVHLIVRSDHGF